MMCSTAKIDTRSALNTIRILATTGAVLSIWRMFPIREYLRDFSNDVDIVASSFVLQRASLNHSGDIFSFNGVVQQYELVNSNLTEASLPFDIKPRLELKLNSQEFGLFEGGIDGEFVEFDHSDSARITGNRRSIEPYVSLPLEEVYGYLEPQDIASQHQLFSGQSRHPDGRNLAIRFSPGFQHRWQTDF